MEQDGGFTTARLGSRRGGFICRLFLCRQWISQLILQLGWLLRHKDWSHLCDFPRLLQTRGHGESLAVTLPHTNPPTQPQCRTETGKGHCQVTVRELTAAQRIQDFLLSFHWSLHFSRIHCTSVSLANPVSPNTYK